ncbi:phosphatase RsbU N-terminal domain-containing protein [Geodermatophilus sp. URMC 64]
MTPVESLLRDYRAAFLGFLPRREEAALLRGYELGRAAMADGLSVLDVARVHHEVVFQVLREGGGDDLSEVASAASEFFLEVLAPFDMTQRNYPRGS